MSCPSGRGHFGGDPQTLKEDRGFLGGGLGGERCRWCPRLAVVLSLLRLWQRWGLFWALAVASGQGQVFLFNPKACDSAAAAGGCSPGWAPRPHGH